MSAQPRSVQAPPRPLCGPRVLAISLVLACSGGSGTSESTATDTAATDTAATDTAATDTAGEGLRPNWHQDVAPLVTSACVGCHSEGGIAPFTMQSYEQTAPWSEVMAYDVDEGLMPPWHALTTEVCAPPSGYKHDPRLTDAEKTLLRDWADLGAPEGDPELAAPLPDPPNLDLASPSKVATMGSSVTVEANGKTLDFFHCLSIDPGNTSDVFLDGLQLIAGNREVLHHVLVYVDAEAESAAWPGGVKQNCGGGTGITGSAPLISTWVPGGLPMETPNEVAIPIPAGSRMILNVHYHATGSGPAVDDATGLAFRWRDTPPEYTSIFALLGQPGAGDSLTGPLLIPAGAKDHVEEYAWEVSAGGEPFPDTIDARLWAVAHHMHRVGVDMRMWVVDRDTGEETCLLHTPRWDFNWQRLYAYDTPVTETVRLKAGDTIRLRCAYDNTLDNPGTAEALAEAGLDAPIDVKSGEETLDEMCVGVIGVALKGL